MSTTRTCPECGTELPPDAPRGHCPKCLLHLGADIASVFFDEIPPGGEGESGVGQSESSPGKVRRFGDYELLEEIAHGGMGVVYKARQVSLNRLVALKMILAGQFARDAEVQRFQTEAEAVANLDHPNIVPIYEVGRHEGRHYFSMKLVEGGSLAKRLAGPATDQRVTVQIIATVARAVHYAHQRLILHRDLKPGNILLDARGQPHVTDFGLAKRAEGNGGFVQSGSVTGTPGYMAPEQADGKVKQLSAAADIYSLGAILYHLLTGRPPFVAGTPLETLRLVVETEPARPSSVHPQVDRDLETVCLKCLEKDPERRYASANALANDLERWIRHEPITARPASTREHVQKWVRRRPPIFFAMASAVVICLLGGIFGIVWQWRIATRALQVAEQRMEVVRKANEAAQTALQAAENSRLRADAEGQRADEMVMQLEVATAREALGDDSNDSPTALARLAGVLRQNPTNQIAANLLLRTLTRRTYARPIGNPIQVRSVFDQVKMSDDGKCIVTCSSNSSTMNILTIRNLGPQTNINVRNDAQIVDFDVSPDGSLVAAGSRERTASVWDTRTGALLVKPIRYDKPLRRIRFSPDGDSVSAYMSDDRLSEWQTFDPHTGAAKAILVPVDWQNTAIQTRLGSDYGSPSQARVEGNPIPAGLRVLLPHAAPVYQATLSSDGLRVATASTDNHARVWDSRTGKLLVETLWHPTPVQQAYFTRDGQTLVTLTRDKVFRIWDVRAAPAWAEPVPGERATGRSNGMNGNDEKDAPVPVPVWVTALAEAIGGKRLNSAGEAEPVTWSARCDLQTQVDQSPGQDSYTRLAKWLFADRSTRNVTPFLNVGMDGYIQERIREDTLESLQEAVRVCPTNALALALFARKILSPDAEKFWAKQEGEFFSSLALEIDPGDPTLWLLRAEFLNRRGLLATALTTIKTAIERFPQHPALWARQGEFLEKAGQTNRAVISFSNAVHFARTNAGLSVEMRTLHLTQHAALRARLGRYEEAGADLRVAYRLFPANPSEDWSGWGGSDPGRNMMAQAQSLPDTVSPGTIINLDNFDTKTSLNLKWAVKLGSQTHGGIVVAEGKVYVGTNNERPRDARHQGDRSVLMCFDEKTGKFLWQLVVPKLPSGNMNDWELLGLVATPAVDGNRLYLATTRGEVVSLTTDGLAKGNVGPYRSEGQYVAVPWQPPVVVGSRDADIVWRYDMIDDLGVFPRNATHSSVLVLGDLVYLGTGNGTDWSNNVPSPNSPTLIALNKKTGELAGEDDAGIGPHILHGQWGSPSAGRVNDKTLIFYGAGDGFCYAFNAIPVEVNGTKILRKVWWADCNPPEYKIKNGKPIKYRAAEGPSEFLATPVFWRNRVYIGTGQDPEHGEGVGHLVCLDATQTGDITKTGLIWASKAPHRTISTVSITPDGLLFISDFSGFLHCLDAETGASFWNHDLRAHVWGGTMVADGKVYIGTEEGELLVFAANKEKKLLSKSQFNAPIYTPAVAANGVLYVATMQDLFAFQDAKIFGESTHKLPDDEPLAAPAAPASVRVQSPR